jgi:hypothetical protein
MIGGFNGFKNGTSNQSVNVGFEGVFCWVATEDESSAFLRN